MENKRMSNQFKIKVIFIFLISNIITFLSASIIISPIEDQNLNPSPIVRAGYSKIIIEAKLNTVTSPSTPVVITNKARSIYIPTNFILDEVRSSPSDSLDLITEKGQKKYIIETKDKNITDLMNSKNLEIIPQIPKKQVIQKHRTKEKYEIII